MTTSKKDTIAIIQAHTARKFESTLSDIRKNDSAFVASVQAAIKHCIVHQLVNGNTTPADQLFRVLPVSAQGKVSSFLCTFGKVARISAADRKKAAEKGNPIAADRVFRMSGHTAKPADIVANAGKAESAIADLPIWRDWTAPKPETQAKEAKPLHFAKVWAPLVEKLDGKEFAAESDKKSADALLSFRDAIQQGLTLAELKEQIKAQVLAEMMPAAPAASAKRRAAPKTAPKTAPQVIPQVSAPVADAIAA